jgi:hypothetical protein
MRQRWLGFVAGSLAATMMMLPVGAAITPAAAQRPNDTRDECIRDGGAWEAVVGVCVFGAAALSTNARRYDLARLEASEPAIASLPEQKSRGVVTSTNACGPPSAPKSAAPSSRSSRSAGRTSSDAWRRAGTRVTEEFFRPGARLASGRHDPARVRLVASGVRGHEPAHGTGTKRTASAATWLLALLLTWT